MDMRGRHGNHTRGKKHPRWTERGFKHKNSNGYIKVLVGKDHPLSDLNGHVYEHLLVWVSNYGPLPANHIIHHKDGNSENNNLDNLEIMTVTKHCRLHSESRRDPVTGRFARSAVILIGGKISINFRKI